MLVRPECNLDTWQPDFSSSGQASPLWTRLSAGELELANSLEAPEWGSNPVQVSVCESCGYPRCAQGGYVHIARTEGHVIWTRPRLDDDGTRDDPRISAASVAGEYGGVAFSAEVWNGWAGRFDSVPEHDSFPPFDMEGLLTAWWMNGPPPVRSSRIVDIAVVEDLLLAADSLETAEALDLARSLLMAWDDEAAALGIDVVPLSAISARIENLHLDGGWTWPAFALTGDTVFPAVSGDWVVSYEIP